MLYVFKHSFHTKSLHRICFSEHYNYAIAKLADETGSELKPVTIDRYVENSCDEPRGANLRHVEDFPQIKICLCLETETTFH